MNKICHVDLRNTNDIPVRSIDFMITYYRFCGNFTDSVRAKFIQVINEESIQKSTTFSTQEFFILATVLILFAVMILFGVFANSLVLFAVLRYRELQTARNVFILNLAISDLCLCILTQPFNLLKMLIRYHPWNYGDVLCKMSSLLQGTNVFVSTITITAIALDRFQVIVYPASSAVQTIEAIVCLGSIWFLSVLMASPLLLFSRVYEDQHGHRACGEDDFRQKRHKLLYTIASIIVQYLVPIVIVSIAYIRIYLRIKYRMINSGSLRKPRKPRDSSIEGGGRMDSKYRMDRRRQKRTTLLLACLASVFVLSWLPLNIVNLYMSVKENSLNFSIFSSIHHSDVNPLTVANESFHLDNHHRFSYSNYLQAGCLLLVLASACINPILYGWLNDNFSRFIRQSLRISRLSDSRSRGGQETVLDQSIIAKSRDNTAQDPLLYNNSIAI